MIEDNRLVKSIKFSKSKYIGDPINAVKIFNDLEVDELILLDIKATINNHEPDFNHIEQIVSEAFMPVAVGGGIKFFSTADKLINIGIEKVILNNCLFESTSVLCEIANKFGSQSVVASIDLKKDFLGNLKIYNYSNKKFEKKSILEHIQNCIDSGAGEIFLNFVDNDGTFSGYNHNMISNLCQKINVPTVVCGGANSLDDMLNAISSGASAAAAGSLFVYTGKHNAVMINYPLYETIKIKFNER
ncbi:MAG: imidazole glycerol phosphate synthase subunit HisF [Chitinophagaceae bacterium]|nr:imidazole glycerol phosphate synthase subunit HisF [Chitinophagaceae bacterium]